MDEYIRKAHVTYIVDGDTLDAMVELGYNVKIEHRFRLLRINTPERNQTGYSEAKKYLSDRVLGEDVWIKSTKSDSFGRYLGEIIFNGVSINQELLDLGLAVPFHT